MRIRRRRCLALLIAAAFLAPAAIQAQQVEQWSVGAEPTLSVGTLEGSDDEMLVNVLMATELSDGTIVLRNSIRNLFEIRYYDASGNHITTASRVGEGPFEFDPRANVFRFRGDSVFVAGSDDRFGVFGPRGEEAREGRMGIYTQMSGWLFRGFDGRRVIAWRSLGAGMPDTGTRRGEAEILSFDLETGALEQIASTLGVRAHSERFSNGVWFYPSPFAPNGEVAVGPGMVWYGDSAERFIHGYRPGAPEPVVTVTSPFEAKPVTGSERSHVRDVLASRGSSPEDEARWARYARQVDFPDRMPWFAALEVDRDGNLWVQEFERFWAEGPQRWAVFSPDGRRIAEVDIPERALTSCMRRLGSTCSHLTGILEIGSNYLLVAQRDEWDVVYLRRYPIEKGGGR